VGAVSGELHITSSESNVGTGIDHYWSRERRLREAEARRHSAIGCTGAIYAIRQSLFRPLRSDTILDDVVIPLQIAAQNYRILHDSKACAFDPQPLEPQSEIRRKRRTLAGNFQMLFRHPQWLLPWGHPLWWRIIAHKYLRVLAPIFLCIVAITSLLLADIYTYRICAILQGVAYSLGILGLLTKSRSTLLSIPSAFLFLNCIVVLAFWDFLFSRVNAQWDTGSAVTPKT
jgi:cellulose synthase/poly-beta-1,6-N-acetylglucosamine synthase-like glycosyltransferase